MTRETQTIWKMGDDKPLLVLQKPDEYYIPLSITNGKVLRELGEAIRDALSDELIQAMNSAKKGGAK